MRGFSSQVFATEDARFPPQRQPLPLLRLLKSAHHWPTELDRDSVLAEHEDEFKANLCTAPERCEPADSVSEHQFLKTVAALLL